MIHRLVELDVPCEDCGHPGRHCRGEYARLAATEAPAATGTGLPWRQLLVKARAALSVYRGRGDEAVDSAYAVLDDALAATSPSPAPLENALRGAFHENGWSVDPYGEPRGKVPLSWAEVAAAILAHLAPTPATPENDLASEYGRLLAERDRLIAAGADPEELELPEQPL